MFSKGAQPEPVAPHSSAIQALAGLAQIVIAVIAYFQLNTPRAWWILALGGALLALTFGAPVVRRAREWWRRRQDDRTASRRVSDLRSLIRNFKKLVDPNANDTVQAVLQQGFSGYANVLDSLHLPTPHFHYELLRNLETRLDNDPADTRHLLLGLDELHTVVSGHSSECILPVFRSMPAQASERLTPALRAMLNSYRERYVAFHAAYGTFTEDLGATLRGTKLHQTYFVLRPDALS